MAAGCGGGDEAPAKPTLNPAVASRLASASDAIAESLDQGDVCAAAGQADDLKHAVVTAINAGEVPQAFQEELMSRANELVDEINCPPPEEEEDEDDNKGKDKDKDKGDNRGEGNGDGGDQQTPTETQQTTTDTSGPG